MSLRSILNPSLDEKIYHSNDLKNPERGLRVPEDWVRNLGFDTGRSPFVNPQTAANYFSNDILAADRLFLPVENRQKPLKSFQRIILKEANEKQFLWLQMMRGGSKSYTLARFCVDYALANADTPIVITAPSFRQALFVFDYAVGIIEGNARQENWPLNVGMELSGQIKRGSLESVIKFHNGSKILALPMGSGEKIRGVRGGVLVIDEFYQITKQMYQSHILPFVQVRQGNKPAKVIHSTTSWYQDCFAYERLMQIASEVKAGNPAYGFLDFNLRDVLKSGFPLEDNVWKDQLRHSDKTTNKMSFFNNWLTTQARWFEQQYIDAAQDVKLGVRVEMEPPKDSTDIYYGMVDVAASEKKDADSTELLVFKYNPIQNRSEVVHAQKRLGLPPSERAYLVHQMNEKWHPGFIVYDAHGAIGTDLRADLARSKVLVKGELKEVTPLVHHDAYNLSGEHKLIPVSVNDTEVQKALIGPRDGTTLRGEAGLKDSMMTKMRDLLAEGKIVGPATASESNGENVDAPDYNGSEIQVLDLIREAFTQLGFIGLKKDKDGQTMRTQDGKNLFKTKTGYHDDGAYCLLGGAIGYLKCVGDGTRSDRAKGRMSPMQENIAAEVSKPSNQVPIENIQKLRFA